MQGIKSEGISPMPAYARKWQYLLLLAVMFLFGQERIAHATYGFSDTYNSNTLFMDSERKNHAATVLADGRVLITGGSTGANTALDTAQIYDPTTGTFAPTGGSMTAPRQFHTATRLADGRVLLIGGNTTGPVATAEIFDPTGAGGTGSFTATGSLSTPLSNFTATSLTNGTVLVAGGQISGSSTTQSAAFIFDPAEEGGVGSFAPTGSMHITRRAHTATLLSNGNVLIAGGSTFPAIGGSTLTGSAEIYYTSGPNAGTFGPALLAATMSARDSAAAVLLSDNRVLVAGGSDLAGFVKTAYIFDPTGAGGAGTFTKTASDMANGHYAHTVTRLLNNKVMIAGGYASFATGVTNAAEFFNPASGGSFSSAGTMTSKRANHSAVPLNDGSVLIAGGQDGTNTLFSAELYSPVSIATLPTTYTFAPAILPVEVLESKVFEIKNTGPSGITLNTIAVSGTDGSSFTLSLGTCGPLSRVLTAGSTCSVTVTFAPLTGGNKTASLSIGSTDPEKPTLSVPLKGTAISLSSIVSVVLAGTGGGSVHSIPSGIACDGSPGAVCQSEFNYTPTFTLSPSSDGNSLFTGWSCTTGDCSWLSACGGAGDCVIQPLSYDIYAIATFTLVKPVKIDGTTFTFDTLMTAYNSVNAGNGSTLDARYFTFSDEVYTFNGKSITIIGGCDLNYAPQSGFYSTVNLKGGSFTIGTGQLTLTNIILQ